MNSKIVNKETDYLFKAILSLKTLEECYTFFEDLCTINEILSMGQRLEVAKCLEAGDTYTEIKERTGASSATISRVNRTFLYGNDAYKMAFERVGDDEEKETEV